MHLYDARISKFSAVCAMFTTNADNRFSVKFAELRKPARKLAEPLGILCIILDKIYFIFKNCFGILDHNNSINKVDDNTYIYNIYI